MSIKSKESDLVMETEAALTPWERTSKSKRSSSVRLGGNHPLYVMSNFLSFMSHAFQFQDFSLGVAGEKKLKTNKN